MSGVSGAGTNYYGQIASGTRIMSAADGPSEMAIIQKQEAQIRGYDMGTRNATDGQSVLNVADGGIAGITDQLQRMRELAVQASNSAVLTDDDRRAIQDEIDQLKEGIAYAAENTEFNTKKLLDGSNSDMQITTGANGEGMQIDTGNATLQALGIANFDVTSGNFDIQTIDNAIQSISQTRSSIGAQYNSLDHAIGYNTNTSYNLTRAMSQMSDTDIEKAVSEQDKKQLLQTMRFMMQKKQEEEERRKNSLLF